MFKTDSRWWWSGLAATLVLGGCTTAGMPAVVSTAGSGSYSYELSNPRVRIRIPELPQIDMGPHPAASRDKPHLRAMGSRAPHIISILTPTADRGMTSQQCAQTSASWLIRRNSLAREDYRVFKGGNSDTYGFIYTKRIGGRTQLVTYLFSGYEGTHCIEVHVSRLADSPGEIEQWARGFPRASIERY